MATLHIATLGEGDQVKCTFCTLVKMLIIVNSPYKDPNFYIFWLYISAVQTFLTTLAARCIGLTTHSALWRPPRCPRNIRPQPSYNTSKFWLIDWLIHECFFGIEGHVALDRNQGRGYNTLFLRLIPGDILSACPYKSFIHYPAFKTDRLFCKIPTLMHACQAGGGGSLYHFYDGLWFDPARLWTQASPHERRTC